MKKRRAMALVLASISLVGARCNGSDTDAGALDSGASDSGASDGGTTDDGGGQGSWVPTSLVGPPPPLGSHVAVWTGPEMVVFRGAPAPVGSTAEVYDPASDTWRPAATASSPPGGSDVAVWTGTEMIVRG
jgi:hypothetical protein